MLRISGEVWELLRVNGYDTRGPLGAGFTIYGNGEAKTVTDENGAFTFEVLPGRWVLTANKPGYVNAAEVTVEVGFQTETSGYKLFVMQEPNIYDEVVLPALGLMLIALNLSLIGLFLYQKTK